MHDPFGWQSTGARHCMIIPLADNLLADRRPCRASRDARARARVGSEREPSRPSFTHDAAGRTRERRQPRASSARHGR